jgi:hypothetical protein
MRDRRTYTSASNFGWSNALGLIGGRSRPRRRGFGQCFVHASWACNFGVRCRWPGATSWISAHLRCASWLRWMAAATRCGHARMRAGTRSFAGLGIASCASMQRSSCVIFRRWLRWFARRCDDAIACLPVLIDVVSVRRSNLSAFSRAHGCLGCVAGAAQIQVGRT